MTDRLVRKLSDGEELVVEELPSSGCADPRERMIEARRLALDEQENRSEGAES